MLGRDADGRRHGVDNCGEVTIEVSSETTRRCRGNYVIVRTFTARRCANSSASQTITVEDTCADLPCDYRRVLRRDADGATASDNSAHQVSAKPPLAMPGNYVIVRTFTATRC